MLYSTSCVFVAFISSLILSLSPSSAFLRSSLSQYKLKTSCRSWSPGMVSADGTVVVKKTDEVTVTEKEVSFVNDVMRPYAMKLHTRDQAPKEGQQPATPPTPYEPTRANYLQFLVDSLVVYEALEEIVDANPVLHSFKNTGLERSKPLKEDIAWMVTYDPSLSIPETGLNGVQYASVLKSMASESIPKFMCHYYNHYFAHTAGGRMIGKRLSDKLLEGKTLKFYQWEGVEDVKVLLEGTKKLIDDLAKSWTDEEQTACLEETIACFRYGGNLMSALKAPASH